MNTRKLRPVSFTAATAALALTIVYGASEATANATTNSTTDSTTKPKPGDRASLTSYELAPGLLKITSRPPGNPT
ncbi:hypothetical protein [Streptomyces nigrescens]